MKIASGILICLFIIGLLTALTVMAAWRWMKHVARRVGLTENQRSTQPIRGYLWLLDRDMEKYLREQRQKDAQ